MSDTEMVRVLFVCMGNICRSPTAEGVFRELLKQEGLADVVETDSAGTHGYHVGRPPDARAQAAARSRDVDISDLRARQVELSDFEYFHWIVAMDNDNLENLVAECPASQRSKVYRLLDFAPHTGADEVPDPYYGGSAGFEQVLDLVRAGSAGLLKAIRDRHGI
ncbi:MAG: low molecular weight phosphotyrosine protein phosphatase [Ectothiorhodospiraceae bacterium]|nr:low molecular weight phosphotyrosine protein phosphatase [Paracoccaceae bacterium]MCH8503728.1 low molecular weight phosphotyrosine protein phosphatase [Ectothiorhodospiraceae bacterium]